MSMSARDGDHPSCGCVSNGEAEETPDARLAAGAGLLAVVVGVAAVVVLKRLADSSGEMVAEMSDGDAGGIECGRLCSNGESHITSGCVPVCSANDGGGAVVEEDDEEETGDAADMGFATHDGVSDESTDTAPSEEEVGTARKVGIIRCGIEPALEEVGGFVLLLLLLLPLLLHDCESSEMLEMCCGCCGAW